MVKSSFLDKRAYAPIYAHTRPCQWSPKLPALSRGQIAAVAVQAHEDGGGVQELVQVKKRTIELTL
jgi:hypothetical protein